VFERLNPSVIRLSSPDGFRRSPTSNAVTVSVYPTASDGDLSDVPAISSIGGNLPFASKNGPSKRAVLLAICSSHLGRGFAIHAMLIRQRQKGGAVRRVKPRRPLSVIEIVALVMEQWPTLRDD
jgi:hypothetical protein